MNEPTHPWPEDMLARLDHAATRTKTPTGAGHMVWRDWGSGPALVLLHGGSGSWRHWARNIEYFARDRRVLAPDLPGLGESDQPERPWTAIHVAGIVLQGILSILGPETKFDLAGFSFGGMLSGHISGMDGTRLRSVTLVGASGLKLTRDPSQLLRVRDKTGQEKIDGHRENLARLMIHDQAKIDDLAITIQDWNSDHNRFNSPPLGRAYTMQGFLERATCRLGGIWGDHDVTAWPHMQERVDYFATIPSFDFRLIPNAGHWVAYEAAEQFNPMLREMLDLAA
ncbi:MAG: alpha/beta fold hydrolase [Acetobacteraceae bacterium]|nr:alpha/beta fold hydrolase [Acetobacteraceae bacterium]